MWVTDLLACFAPLVGHVDRKLVASACLATASQESRDEVGKWMGKQEKVSINDDGDGSCRSGTLSHPLSPSQSPSLALVSVCVLMFDRRSANR